MSPPHQRPRVLGRVLLAVVAAALALLGVELTLRATFAYLPSVAPLEGAALLPRGPEQGPEGAGDERRNALCRDGHEFRPRPPAWSASLGPAEGEPIALWAVGDSVNMGFGVEPEQSYAWLLGQRLAEHSGRPVRLRNISVNGGSFCQVLRELNGHLALERPHLVLASAFVDDLEDRALFLVEGRAVAFPAQARSAPLRWLVGRSYTANYLWIGWLSRVGGARRRFLSAEDQRWFGDAYQALDRRLEEDAIPWVLALLSPTGMPLCAQRPELEACRAMVDDGRLIAGILAERGLAVQDLRGFWDERPGRVLPVEEDELARRGALPIHPDPRGHQELAEALWPPLLAAWERGGGHPPSRQP
jgi:hypothetical protein